MSTSPPDVLWMPDQQRAAASAIVGFTRFVRERHGVQVADMEYADLHAWSVQDLEGFWSAAAEFLGVRFQHAPAAVLGAASLPGAEWFPGATLNYAEHALRPGPGRGNDDLAIVFAREDGLERIVTYAELQDLVARARAGLVRLGVGRGDRVVALAPNSVETLVTFLAAASLGAVWSSCSPDFGVRAVRDRFAQIEPSVLLAVDGYCYGGKRFDIRATVQAIGAQLPTWICSGISPAPCRRPSWRPSSPTSTAVLPDLTPERGLRDGHHRLRPLRSPNPRRRRRTP